MNGKGSNQRPGKVGAYRTGWDRVFGETEERTILKTAQEWIQERQEDIAKALKTHQYACVVKGQILTKTEL